MRIAIVGSRNYPRLDQVRDYVASLPPNTVVISGGARGVDKTAEEEAKRRGLECAVFLAEWDEESRFPGLVRHRDIVEAAEKVVAFWDGRSHGTAYALKLAQQLGKPVEVYRP